MDEIADKGELLVMANLAEQAERYEDMVKAMKSIVVLSEELNSEERNMLSVAYKNVIGARRAAWRIFASLEQKHEGNQNEKELVVGYRETVEKEIQEISDGILELLDTYLIPKAQTSESKVFFHKMKGDYHRYLTEIMQGEDRKGPAEKALDAYKDAEKEAEDLPSTNPISLGLALNFSVFYYEILDSPEKACRLAKKAFDGAVGDLEKSSESQFKESALILQLLRDNLTLWTSEMQEDGGDDDV